MCIISHKLLFFCPLIQETPDEGWHELVSKGYIEYIDTEEEETTMISMTINVSEISMCTVYLIEHILRPLCMKEILSIYHSRDSSMWSSIAYNFTFFLLYVPSPTDTNETISGPSKCKAQPRGGLL
jgi:hypothetical protein